MIPRKRRVVATRVATALTFALGATGCSGGPDLRTAGGGEIVDAKTFIASVTDTWRGSLVEVDVADEASCFFSAQGEAVTTAIFCGPVLHQFGAEGMYWDRFEAQFNPDGDDVRASLLGDTPEVGVAPPTKLKLLHPDGRKPQDGDGLKVPPPPVLDDVDEVLTMDPEEALIDVRKPQDGRLRSAVLGLVIDGVSQPDVIGQGLEQRRAPDGHKLFAITVASDPGVKTYKEDRATVTLITGSKRRAVNELSDLQDGARTTLGFVAREGEPISLEMSDGRLTQAFDLENLVRTGENIEVLYRGDKYPFRVEPNVVHDVPYERFERDGRPEDIRGKMALSLKTAFLDYGTGDDMVSSGPDRAVLSVQGDARVIDTFGDGGWGIEAIPLDRVVLELPSGEKLKPKRAYPSDEWALFGGSLYFDVPASFTTGKLHVTPGRLNSVSTTVGGITWAFAGSYEFPLSFE